MTLYSLIGYSGMLAFIALLITVILGITRINFELHKIAGISTFVLACVHGGFVLYKNIKVKKASRAHKSS